MKLSIFPLMCPHLLLYVNRISSPGVIIIHTVSAMMVVRTDLGVEELGGCYHTDFMSKNGFLFTSPLSATIVRYEQNHIIRFLHYHNIKSFSSIVPFNALSRRFFLGFIFYVRPLGILRPVVTILDEI